MCQWAWCASAAFLVACGGEAAVQTPNEGDPELAELPQTQLICDGSDEIRFVFSSGGGRSPLTEVFGGSRYITIDGHCRFWVYENLLRGLRTGELDAAFARQLSSELHIGSYASAQSEEQQFCPDAGWSGLWDGTAALTDNCGGSPDAPLVAHEAFARVRTLFDELDVLSDPAWEKTHVLPLREPRRPDALAPLAWTASLDLDSYAVYADYPTDFALGLALQPGALVEDQATLVELANLRNDSIEQRSALASPSEVTEYTYPGLFVVDTQGREFQVLLRDEPPSAIARAAAFGFGNE